MNTADCKYTILYARHSNDEGREGASNSIHNQRSMLERYAEDNGFENALFMADDGYSGTNFNRPSWVRVMYLIENDEVSTLIVRDMSRLGREYLQVGRLTELVFPNCGIRFIAIQDNVDSLYGDSDFTPFKNLLNDLYAKDASKKIRAVKRAQAERGERVASRASYGYMKCEKNQKLIVPDEHSSSVVQRIFSLSSAGMGPSQIASMLCSEQVLTPGNYYFSKTGVILANTDTARPFDWSCRTVASILEDEVYLGHTVSLKSTTVSYKNKTRIYRPPTEHIRREHTHIPLVNREIWDIVQSIRQHKRRRANLSEQNAFSGLVYCADCRSVMTLQRSRAAGATKNAFVCSTYRKRGKEQCSIHYIRESALAATVLSELRKVIRCASENETSFSQCVSKSGETVCRQEVELLQSELAVMGKRNEELHILFKRLYEDNVFSRISEEQFRSLAHDYREEQSALSERMRNASVRVEELKKANRDVSLFIEKAKRFEDTHELTAAVLLLYIERIEVLERDERYVRAGDERVNIRFRDIGLVSSLP